MTGLKAKFSQTDLKPQREYLILFRFELNIFKNESTHVAQVDLEYLKWSNVRIGFQDFDNATFIKNEKKTETETNQNNYFSSIVLKHCWELMILKFTSRW